MTCALLVVLLAAPASSLDTKGQAGLSAERSRSGASSASPEAAASDASTGFGAAPSAPAADLRGRNFKAAPPAALTAKPAAVTAAPPPAPGKVYAAGEKKAEDGPKWDREGTLKAGAVGMAGALIGFMLGGPIGACAGFLAAFFVGAMLWKAGKI
ncbi:MAG: hypothetical protein HY928_07110 [Elusimicrobia bacterium]|nr:hypothetical protein [Elusimicrobiota bacterium]